MYCGGKAPVFEQTLQPLLPPPSPILSSLPLIIMMILLMMMIMIINKKKLGVWRDRSVVKIPYYFGGR